MSAAASLIQSTVGKKIVMALTGLVMVGWLFLHMSGNLLVFVGQEEFNHYAHFIQSGFGATPEALWVMRFVMLGAIVLHIWSAIALSKRNAAARPVAYAGGREDRATKYVAHFMRGGGIVLVLYLIFHLLHLTVGSLGETAAMPHAFDRHDAYANLVLGVGVPWVGAFYILANLALGAHLWHGVESAFQTLGVNDPRWNGLKHGLGVWVPLIIAGGNVVIALAVMAGVVAAPDPSWTPNF